MDRALRQGSVNDPLQGRRKRRHTHSEGDADQLRSRECRSRFRAAARSACFVVAASENVDTTRPPRVVLRWDTIPPASSSRFRAIVK